MDYSNITTDEMDDLTDEELESFADYIESIEAEPAQ